MGALLRGKAAVGLKMQAGRDSVQGVRVQQETLWLLAAAVTPLFVNLWVEQPFEASKVWLLRSLIWALGLICFAGWMGGGLRRSVPDAVTRLVAALALVMGMATLLSSTPATALMGSLDRGAGLLTQISYLLLFICAAGYIEDDGIRRLIRLIVWTGLPISLLGLAQLAGWQPVPLLSDARSPLITTLGRANFTGAYLALLLPMTLACAGSTFRLPHRLGYGALFLLFVSVIVFTRARAAWVGGATGLALFVWLMLASTQSRRFRRVSVLTGVAIWALALVYLLQQGIGAGGSIAARWTIWRASLRLIWPRLWLGYGADTLDLHFPSVYPPELVYYQGRGVVVDRAHNWILDWTLNYGVVATLLFGILVLFILHLGWRALLVSKQDSHSVQTIWLAASMAAIGVQLTGNLFLFDVAATALVFWMLLAILVAYSGGKRVIMDPGVRSRQIRNGLMGAGAFLLLTGVWAANLAPMMADFHSRQGTIALGQGDELRAQVEYGRAIARAPYRSEYHLARGLTQASEEAIEPAAASVQRAIDLRPTDPLLYVHLAEIHAKDVDGNSTALASVYGAYNRAIELAPTVGLVHRHHAELALEVGDLPTALVRSQRAVDLDATDGVAYAILSRVLFQLGRIDEAQRACESALRWAPYLRGSCFIQEE